MFVTGVSSPDAVTSVDSYLSPVITSTGIPLNSVSKSNWTYKDDVSSLTLASESMGPGLIYPEPSAFL